MFPVHVPPTNLDRSLADLIADNTAPPEEHIAGLFTWGADDHVLIAAAATFLLLSLKASPRQKRFSRHLLATAIASGVAPHILKRAVDQRRPDRTTLVGHLNGVPLSGKTMDAFPSGHAVHMGALASAACDFKEPYRKIAWTAALGLSMTRVGVLAHWASDVFVGFAGGFALERLVRRLTGYPGGNRG